MQITIFDALARTERKQRAIELYLKHKNLQKAMAEYAKLKG